MSISTSIRSWSTRHPKLTQWLWFAGLWCAGLLAVSTLTYPIKFLMKQI